MIKPLNKDTTWSIVNSYCCPLQQCCPLHILITYSPQTGTSGLTKYGPTGEGNGKPLQYSCLENSMNSESESRSVRLFATSWTIQSNEFSRPECLLWSLNLISDSSAFSKSSLNMWKFSVHVLSKPCLENFEHYFASLWGKCNCVVVWTFFGIALLWDWNENWPSAVMRPLLSFPNLLAYWVHHFNSIIF